MRKKIWKVKSVSSEADRLADSSGIPIPMAQLLVNRGIGSRESLNDFMNPRLSNLLDPWLLKDMDKAVDLILEAMEGNQKIMIFGDFDVDGITSTSLLLKFFSALDLPSSFFIPNRLTDGYGLNSKAIEKISREGYGLIITVDCGISNREEIQSALDRGMKVVVTDHHQVPEDFDPPCPVINPHRDGSRFPFRNLAGVGVAFFLTIAIRGALRERGWFKKIPEPDLKTLLDLVALGSVADMVPLVGQNRILVYRGIEILKKSPSTGIRALQEVAGLSPDSLMASDLAFKLGPRLNAPGRMTRPEIGVKLLTTDDASTARDLAKEINRLNFERQSTERSIFMEIEERLAARGGPGQQRILFFTGEGWHKGVLGIVASRLVERYHRPALVSAREDGLLTGSGRSIDGFNLYQGLTRFGHLFERFGGHAHAVGFALKERGLQSLRSGLEDMAAAQADEKDLVHVIEADGEVALGEITEETVRQIGGLGPFGSGNPDPLFYIQSLRVVESRVVGKKHLRLRVKEGRLSYKAIGFGLSDMHPLNGRDIHMICTPEINRWQGTEEVQLRVADLEVMGEGTGRITLEKNTRTAEYRTRNVEFRS